METNVISRLEEIKNAIMDAERVDDVIEMIDSLIEELSTQ